MNTNRTMIVAEKNHPLYDELKKHFHVKHVDEAITSYDTYDIVIDLTILRTEKKLFFLRELVRSTKANIISDLTCTFQEKIFHSVPQVKASVSSFFYSPMKTVEFFIRADLEEHLQEAISQIIMDFFNTLKRSSTRANFLELTFTTPRVVSQIINEAYFALEEKLASPEDIDSSMLYGVNYPVGPIEWGHKSGLVHIHSLLEELYSITLDPRYRPSLKLKKECL